MMTLTIPAELTLEAARGRLCVPHQREAVLPALAASALVAVFALLLAAAVVLGPPKAWAAKASLAEGGGQPSWKASTDTRSAHRKASATSSNGRRSTSD